MASEELKTITAVWGRAGGVHVEAESPRKNSPDLHQSRGNNLWQQWGGVDYSPHQFTPWRRP